LRGEKMITWGMKQVFSKWEIGKGSDEYERGLTNLNEALGYEEEREPSGTEELY